MERSKLIIIEGPQGVGKSGLTSYLREKVPSCDLYRLSGVKDKTITGREKSIQRYYSLMAYLKEQESVGLNELFDRTFPTDYVYANLGYKEYDFEDIFKELTEKLNNLNFDIYYFSLYLEDPELFKIRLQRDDKHSYQEVSIDNSLKQQEEYKKVADYFKTFNNIKVYEIATDDFDKAYRQIDKILGIEKE